MLNNDGQATGIGLPFRGTPFGGLRLEAGDELIIQYVMTYVADCESDNPFQDLGIGLGPIFQVANDPSWRAKVRRDVEDMFNNYLVPSNLARLDRVEFTQVEGEVQTDIWFISIESEERRQVTVPLARNPNG